MLNVSREMPGIGAGVLIRALDPLEGIPITRLNRGIERLRDLARGPGRLTAVLRVDRWPDGLNGSDAVTTNPAISRRALGSAFRGMAAVSCDFIFGTVVRRRSKIAQH
jgi:3-methyladenine DNA glycosylase Mpg